MVGLVVWIYAYLALGSRPTPLHFWVALVLFSGTAIALLLFAKAAAAPSFARTVAASIVDIATASYLMMVLGEAGAPLVTIYVITCMDTGFQHGRKGLAAASLTALACFAVVGSYTEYWQAQLLAAITVVSAFIGAVMVTALNGMQPAGTRHPAVPAFETPTNAARESASAQRLVAGNADTAATRFAGGNLVDITARDLRHRSPTRLKILVVDDNATNRIIAEAILNAAGHETDAVDNAQTALERLVSGHYRLAVVDMHMPDMGGVALLRRYRNMCPTERVPIVILTANATSEAAQEVADAGADGFLTKPVSARSLVTTVEKLLADNEAGTLRPVNVQPSEDNGPTRIIDTAVIQELQKVCGSLEEFSGLVTAFKDEGAALLHKFAKAIGSGDLKSVTDCALALRASAVNFGGLALAESCEWASQLNESQFRSIGQEAVDRVTLRFETTVRELDRLVDNARAHTLSPLPRSKS
jgi:CheY-like chemotaxis protein/HPt (histidine-containing phosphotransfer) domain-containing protein